MRFSRLQGVLTAAALLAALPAHCQTPAVPAPNTASPTLTPPGSITPVPLLPNAGGAGVTGTGNPGFTLPPVPLNTPSFGGTGLSGFGGGTGTDLSSVLSGSSSLPMSLTLGQLDSNWRRMTITGTFDLGSVTQTLTSLLGSAGIGVYYTKGETVTVGQTTYLVAYRTQPQVLDVATLLQAVQTAQSTGKPPAAQKLTPQTPLSLALLNLQTSGSLTDIRPFNLARELADSAAAVHAYDSLLDLLNFYDATPTVPVPVRRPTHKSSPS